VLLALISTKLVENEKRRGEMNGRTAD